LNNSDSLHHFTSSISLVGGFNPSEKYEFVSWGDSSEYMEKKVPNHHPDSVIIYRNWGVPGVPHQKKSRGGNFQLGNLGLDQKRIGFCQ
jgi:hypothetical protein